MNLNILNSLEFPSVKETNFAFLSGGGETGQLIREFDWSKSSLGPISSWTQSLRIAISICLNSKFPMSIWWGPELIILYNDAYRSIIVDKHPSSLGSAGKKVWPDIWNIIGPRLKGVLNKGESTWYENQLLLLNRQGYTEECYFTFSYSPIYDENGGVSGVFTAVTETTKTVLDERQLQTLNKLGETISNLKEISQVYKKSMEILTQNQYDFPFALLYETNSNSKLANLVGCSSVNPLESTIPKEIDLSASNCLSRINPLLTVLSKNKLLIVEKINEIFGLMPKGIWHVSSDKALVLPLLKRGQNGKYGFLIIGLNPYFQLSAEYLSFFSLVADKITSSISNAYTEERAKILEQEVKRRTCELNELNISLKQSNIELQQFAHVASHDLKEPLRKIKIFNGRLANDKQSAFSENSKNYINKIESAANRLCDMVEGVLNYSMLNNTEQKIEEINLNELINNIKSDLELLIGQKNAQINCSKLSNIEGAAVLIYQLFYNLINNSLKFSRPDTPLIISISSTLIQKSGVDSIEITIADNGIGFEPGYSEKIFTTFTRLNSKDKYEGTGLGLALCKRIIQRHSGTIKATGNLNKGAIFSILLPVKQKLEHL